MYCWSFHSQHHVLFNCLSSSAFAGTYRDVCVWTETLFHRASDANERFCAAGRSERDRHRRLQGLDNAVWCSPSALIDPGLSLSHTNTHVSSSNDQSHIELCSQATNKKICGNRMLCTVHLIKFVFVLSLFIGVLTKLWILHGFHG